MREKVLYQLYQQIKLNSFSLEDFFKKYDQEKKAYFFLEEFNFILKEFQLNLDPQDLSLLGQQMDQNSKKISINQLIFYLEEYLKEDIREVL